MFGNAAIYMRRICSTIIPTVKCTRIAKFCMALTPFMSMFIGILMIIFVLTNEAPTSRNHHRSRKISNKKSPSAPRESLAEFVERIGVCETVAMEEFSTGNITLPNNDTFVVNATVSDICRNLTSLRAAYFRPKETKVNPFVYDYLISANSTCHKQTDIIVLVHSYHTYFDRRESIRLTWGGAIRKNYWPTRTKIDANIKLVFVLGLHE